MTDRSPTLPTWIRPISTLMVCGEDKAATRWLASEFGVGAKHSSQSRSSVRNGFALLIMRGVSFRFH